MDIKSQVISLRDEFVAIEKNLFALRGAILSTPVLTDSLTAAFPPDRREMIANATLAHRHAQDAVIRLDKVIEAHEGGPYVYQS